jgi:hypothetical protein
MHSKLPGLKYWLSLWLVILHRVDRAFGSVVAPAHLETA